MNTVLLVALMSLGAGGDAPPKELTVIAAASLRDAFTTLGRSFEASHPGVHVTFAFAGSQGLRAQVEHGAAADVFASADPAPLQALASAKLAGPSIVFAQNVPVVVVPAGNPSKLSGFDDLPKAKRLVIGVAESPIGTYTLKVFARAEKAKPGFLAAVTARVASRELNVRQVLAKVSLGEADAGVVYRTDARSAGAKVSMFEIPAALNETADYGAAALTRARDPALARAFIDLLTSAEGQRVLGEQGFLPRP